MLYAIENGLDTIVAAADTLVEFEKFVQKVDTTIVSVETLGVVSADHVDMMSMLTEDVYQGFRAPPIVVVNHDAETQKAFAEKFELTLGKRNFVLNKQNEMLDEATDDPWIVPDGRSIEDIHDLVENDQWDKRSDEERADDEANKKAYKEAQEKGELSGDSFGPKLNKKKTDPQVMITDIRTHRNADGEVVIDNVLSVKGLYDKDDPDAVPEEVDLADEDMTVDTDGVIAIYHKVDVTGAKLVDIGPCLEAADFDLDNATVKRNSSTGCWFALMRQFHAEQAFTILEAAGFNVETYAVNDAGERLVPKGVQVVTEEIEGEQFPRPWNFRSKEIGKMKAVEKRANIKTMKPGEFIFVGNYENARTGTVIYITPRLFFNEHQAMWPKPLDIAHLLPGDIEELSPGIYRTKSRDWNSVSYDLNSRGFKEQLGLQIWLNQQ